MYSNIVLNILNNPKNAGRISKPDGIAAYYNENQTAHVEFSLRIESGIITDCKFRAQANPYIIAICSTMTNMVKGKMCSMVFLDPYSIKTELGDDMDIDIMFCIDCFKLALQDYKEKLEKTIKHDKKSSKTETEDEEVYSIEHLDEENESINENAFENAEPIEEIVQAETVEEQEESSSEEDDDDFFGDDFFEDFFDEEV